MEAKAEAQEEVRGGAGWQWSQHSALVSFSLLLPKSAPPSSHVLSLFCVPGLAHSEHLLLILSVLPFSVLTSVSLWACPLHRHMTIQRQGSRWACATWSLPSLQFLPAQTKVPASQAGSAGLGARGGVH
jgi:hypothetical protein